MKNTNEGDKSQQKETEPVIENEALKNSEKVSEDKKNNPASFTEDPPGYPLYPASEDMLNPSNDMERVDIDLENTNRAGNFTETGQQAVTSNPPLNENLLADALDDDEDLGVQPATEADITKDDLIALGPKDQDMDLGEDEDLQNKGFPLGMTGEDLDVPGDELDDGNEDIGEEDEENNYYSLGGDKD